MNIDELKNLIRAVGMEPIAELEYREGDLSVRIVKRTTAPARDAVEPLHSDEEPPEVGPPVSDSTVPARTGGEKPSRLVAAPLPGLFYRQAKPNEPPFAEVGVTVAKGQTLGLIEAMKMVTAILAPASGTLSRIFVDDGTLVEEGAPLFEIG